MTYHGTQPSPSERFVSANELERERNFFVGAVRRGEATPAKAATDGQTFYIERDETTPYVSIGRIPMPDGRPSGMHILRAPDGALTWQAGYWLRRPGEQWTDPLGAE